MAGLRKPLDFAPARRGRGRREEVQVGAYARRQLRRRVLVGVFGVLLIGGAVALYQKLRPADGGGIGERYAVRVRCVSCGHAALLEVPFSQTFPMECAACKEMTARELWKCRECGALFVPQQTGPERRCPECNSELVGSAAAG